MSAKPSYPTYDGLMICVRYVGSRSYVFKGIQIDFMADTDPTRASEFVREPASIVNAKKAESADASATSPQ